MGRASPFVILPPAPPAAASSYGVLLSTRLILTNVTEHGVLCVVHSDVTINYHELVQCAETPLPWPLQLICMPHQIATDD